MHYCTSRTIWRLLWCCWCCWVDDVDTTLTINSRWAQNSQHYADSSRGALGWSSMVFCWKNSRHKSSIPLKIQSSSVPLSQFVKSHVNWESELTNWQHPGMVFISLILSMCGVQIFEFSAAVILWKKKENKKIWNVVLFSKVRYITLCKSDFISFFGCPLLSLKESSETLFPCLYCVYRKGEIN